MTHITMKGIFNIATYINLLICLLLMCSCYKTSMYDADTDDADPTDSYLNLSFGTRSSLPSVAENKEWGVQHLRVMIFDATGGLLSNTKYTDSNVGRVPNPVIKVPGGETYTIYAIANENHRPIANILPNQYLTDVLNGVKKISDVEAVAVQLTLDDYSQLPSFGLLMIGSTEVNAKLGHSMIYPQDVSIAMKRLTSKITINARRDTGMIVEIIKIEPKNLYQKEYLIAKSPNYLYPLNSHRPSLNIPITIGGRIGEGSAAVPFPLFNRYYLGTNYAGDKFLFSMDIIYKKKVGTGDFKPDTTTITIPSAVERNMEYTFNLNFLQSTVKVDFSVKDWDDQGMSGEVVAGTFLSLSQSELTMYGPYPSTIYLQTDATKVEAELLTEGGELIDKYFKNLQKGITINKGSGAIVLNPIETAMSTDPTTPTQIGLYFKTGNIRKLVRVTHINKKAYTVKLDANGGYFGNSSITTRDGGSAEIGSGYTIKNMESFIPVRIDHELSGWALSKTALLKEFSAGDNVSYEALERPKDLLTLYAVWRSRSKVSLLFDPNGRVAVNMPITIVDNPNTSVSISPIKPTITGSSYIFKEWNTRSDGKGIGYAVGSSYDLGATTIVLYAIWTTPVKVTLYKNDGTTSTPLVVYSANDGPTFTIAIPDPTNGTNHFMGWNTTPTGGHTFYEKNKAYPFPNSSMSLYAIWKRPVKISHKYPDGYIAYPGLLDPYDRAGLKPGEKITLSKSLYFSNVPWYVDSPRQVYEGKEASLAQKFLYWRDTYSGKTYYGPNDTFIMPDDDVTLEAVYETNIGTFEFWNWVGGTSFTYHIKRDFKNGEGLRRASSEHFFGYWGKVHYPPYPEGEDFEIYIHSSWNPPPRYGVLVTFGNGKIKWHDYSSRPPQTTRTPITAKEIKDNGGIRHVKISAARP